MKKLFFLIAIAMLVTVLFLIWNYLAVYKLIEYSLNVRLPENVRIVDYRLNLRHMYVKAVFKEEQLEEVVSAFTNAISFEIKTSEYLEEIRDREFYCAERVDDSLATNVHIYQAIISGSPASVVIIIMEESQCYLYAIIDF